MKKNEENNMNFFGIYEKKSVRQKSMDNSNIKKISLLNDLNDNKLDSNSNNFGNNNIKINKSILQNSINDTKIIFFNNPKEKNKMKLNKAKNIIDKSIFYNNISNNKIINNITKVNPEVIQNIPISNSNKGIKRISKSFNYNNNSFDKSQEINEAENINKLKKKNKIINRMNKEKNISSFKYQESNFYNLYNDYYDINNSLNAITEQYRHKKNNSVENNIKSKNINFFINKTINTKDNIDTSYNQTYNNKQDNNIYVHKRFITLDISKSISSFESNTSSIISSASSKNNIFLNDSPFINKQMTKNKTNFINKSKKLKLFIGLELGNTECKIGLFNKNNDKNENLTCLKIPTIISFFPNTNNPNKINIKVGNEAEKFVIDNYDQTIFNIIKLFGQNNNDISGKKELWPFNIYNDSNINRPMIKIKYLNNDIYYNIEDILIIYLRKAFELFFDKLKFGQNKDKVYLIINIAIGVPNYFNYLQRNLLLKIFSKNLFHKKNYNKYSKYNIELKNIYIESASNLISYSLFENYFQQKFNVHNLILSIEGCSTNISLVKLSKDHKNNYIEIKYINSAEFGEEDFLDNLINSCLAQFKEKIKNNCLNTPSVLARIRKALNETKKKNLIKKK